VKISFVAVIDIVTFLIDTCLLHVLALRRVSNSGPMCSRCCHALKIIVDLTRRFHACMVRQMSGYWNWAVRSIVDIEVQMAAVQRIHDYCTIPSECQSSTGRTPHCFLLVLTLVMFYNIIAWKSHQFLFHSDESFSLY